MCMWWFPQTVTSLLRGNNLFGSQTHIQIPLNSQVKPCPHEFSMCRVFTLGHSSNILLRKIIIWCSRHSMSVMTLLYYCEKFVWDENRRFWASFHIVQVNYSVSCTYEQFGVLIVYWVFAKFKGLQLLTMVTYHLWSALLYLEHTLSNPKRLCLSVIVVYDIILVSKGWWSNSEYHELPFQINFNLIDQTLWSRLKGRRLSTFPHVGVD